MLSIILDIIIRVLLGIAMVWGLTILIGGFIYGFKVVYYYIRFGKGLKDGTITYNESNYTFYSKIHQIDKRGAATTAFDMLVREKQEDEGLYL